MDNSKISITQFIGSWELHEWRAESMEGDIVYPFGPDAIGEIVYNDDGHMSVQIMKPNRAKFVSDDPLEGQRDEILSAYKGFIAYSGTYEVNEKSNQVFHHIKISSFPNWVGQKQIRNFEFRDNLLILSTDFIESRKHRLIWHKREQKDFI